MGLGRRLGPPKTKICSTSSHTAPQGPRYHLMQYEFCLGAFAEFQPWGGLGEPGEACVKCGRDPTTLGAHAPTRGALPKMQQ
jgi:hypothetical protein